MANNKKCIFCGREAESKHHILPKSVKKALGWSGKQASESLASKTVPLCDVCHPKATLLIEPLVKIVNYVISKPPIPVEFAFIMDYVHKTLTKDDDSL